MVNLLSKPGIHGIQLNNVFQFSLFFYNSCLLILCRLLRNSQLWNWNIFTYYISSRHRHTQLLWLLRMGLLDGPGIFTQNPPITTYKRNEKWSRTNAGIYNDCVHIQIHTMCTQHDEIWCFWNGKARACASCKLLWGNDNPWLDIRLVLWTSLTINSLKWHAT